MAVNADAVRDNKLLQEIELRNRQLRSEYLSNEGEIVVEDDNPGVSSSRPAERKHDLENEHILANPELYGLRRSVRFSIQVQS